MKVPVLIRIGLLPKVFFFRVTLGASQFKGFSIIFVASIGLVTASFLKEVEIWSVGIYGFTCLRGPAECH